MGRASNRKSINNGYNGNPLLKGERVQIDWSPGMLAEYMKCMHNPIYFAEMYIKITHVDHGLIEFKLYDYQKEIIEAAQKNRMLIVNASRQCGKTTTAVGLLLHYVLFNSHKVVAILANKGDAAREVLARVKLGFESLPSWLQQGVKEWNKGSIELENGMKIIASSTSGSAIRGKSCVGGDTRVSVMDMGGHVSGISIHELSLVDHTNYKIFDGYTYRSFSGILVQEKELFTIKCELSTIDATDDHRFMDFYGNWVYVRDIKIGDMLLNIGKVISITPIGIHKVYDPINVETTNRYWSNGFISHNCAFLYIDECVTGDTQVTIRSIIDSAEMNIPVGSLFSQLSNEQPNNKDVFNYAFEVLTEDGFKAFGGIKRKTSDTIRLHLSDGSELGCTASHLVKMNNGEFIEAHDIDIGDVLSTGISLLAINSGKSEFVYDLLDVVDTHHYITNNVVSHNCAFINNWEEFYSSVFPTLSSGKTTKMLFTSTPHGLNHYYHFWKGAIEGTNGFVPIEVTWDRVPERDEEWKKKMLEGMNHDHAKFDVEFNCVFEGSSGTLLNGATLKSMKAAIPISTKDGLKVYSPPIKDRIYVNICDVSHGKGLDYSTFHVIDVTELPYQQVCSYRSNEVTPTDFAEIINRVSLFYNKAYVLVENNDIGAQVTYILWNELEYENILSSRSNGKTGKILEFGISKKSDIGIRTTRVTKSLGCSVLKLIAEQRQLEIVDQDTISELSVFSKKGSSYEAETGHHDDTVMPLVIFAWMTTTQLFKEITNIDVMNRIRDVGQNELAERLMTVGIIVQNGIDEVGVSYERFDGDTSSWTRVEHDSLGWNEGFIRNF